MRVTDLEVDNIDSRSTGPAEDADIEDWMRDGEELQEVVEHESGDNSDKYSSFMLLCVSTCACLIILY